MELTLLLIVSIPKKCIKCVIFVGFSFLSIFFFSSKSFSDDNTNGEFGDSPVCPSTRILLVLMALVTGKGPVGKGYGIISFLFNQTLYFCGGEKTFYTKMTKGQGVRGVGYLKQLGSDFHCNCNWLSWLTV